MKLKSKILSIVLMLTIAVFSITLFACAENTYTVSIESSEGGVVSGAGKIEKGKEVTISVTPYEYVTFMGWQIVGTNKYLSTDATYTFVPTDDIVIKPVFKSSPYDVLNKILNGAMNKYEDFPQNAEEWKKFSLSTEFDFGVNNLSTSLNKTQNLNIKLDANINLNGLGTAINLQISDKKTNNTVFGLYYSDNNADGSLADLYINLTGNKFHYDFLKLSDIIGIANNLMKPTPALNAETQTQRILDLREIIKNSLGTSSSTPIIMGIVDSILGMDNSFGLFGNIVVGENKASFELYLDAFLSSIGNILSNVNLEELGLGTINTVIDGLTKNYQNGGYPFIILNVNAGFTKVNNKSVLNNVNLDFSIDEDYVIDYGNAVTIKATDINFNVKNLNINYVKDTFPTIEFNTQGYKAEKINLINFESHGNMDFASLTADNKTIDNHMTVNLYADLNPFALLTGLTNTGFDAKLIDWKNIGLLNLQLYNETINEDFLNIMFNSNDVKTDSVQLFMRSLGKYDAGFIKIPIEVNTSYDITAFMKFIESGFNLNLPTQPTTFSSSLQSTTTIQPATNNIKNILNIVTNLLPNLLDIGTKDFGEILVNTAKSLVTTLITETNQTPTTEIIKKIINEDITYNQETGVNIKLDNIKPHLIIDGTDIGTILLGNSNLITIKLDSFNYGSVEKNTDGNYINNNGTLIIDDYATLHNTAVKITTIPELDNLKVVSGIQLTDLFNDSKILKANVINIDGTTSSDFGVQFADVVYEKDTTIIGKQKVKFVMRANNGLIDGVLYKMIGFPVSMLTYETEIEIVPPPTTVDDITFTIENTIFEAGKSVMSLGTATFAGNTVELKVVNDNGAFLNNVYVSGKYEVIVEAFGFQKSISITNYEYVPIVFPEKLDINDADLLSNISGTTLKIGTETLQPTSIQIGKQGGINDPSNTYYDFTATGTTALSDEFKQYLKDNKLKSVCIRYIFNIEGTEKLFYKYIQITSMDFYVALNAYSHPFGYDASILIGMYSNNTFKILLSPSSSLNDFKNTSTYDFEGTWELNGTQITLTTSTSNGESKKYIANGTLENNVLHLDLSTFLFYNTFPLPNDVTLNLQ